MMAICIKKNPDFDYALPKAICSECGHVQTVYMGSNAGCAMCKTPFHKDSFEISKKLDVRVNYYKGGIVNATGT